ncbi:MAG: ABC transporter ATP-binding protein [Firmicutes bacterium]|jgi:ABC-2 type transport system ATP-binding protein|nr:ABC transporter ATP-binding protein [Bacillota bacterium]HQD39584.1 ABC transporter ATP-binding protein [Bacillota bacterium]
MAIEVRALCKSFGSVQVLKDLSFRVPKGSITGFLGPNGAGKTTTLKLLLGLLYKDRGQVRLFGEEIETRPPQALKRRIGYLAEEPLFPPQLTGWEVLALVAENYGLSNRAKAKELLTMFQLEDAAGRKVASYSRGMKQKLGLACALLPEPELLILDEPVSAMDPAGRRQVLTLLGDLAGSTTVFFSSHILADVERVCQRVIVIKKGRKLLESSLDELTGRTDYYLKLKDTEGEGLKYIEQDPAVSSVQAEGEGYKVKVKEEMLQHFRTKTLLALLQKGVELVEVKPRAEQLEEVYLNLLEEGDENV